MLHKLSFPPSVLSSEHLWDTRNNGEQGRLSPDDLTFPLPTCGLWVLHWMRPMQGRRASQVVLVVKNLPANSGDIETRVRSLGQEDPLEKEMATHRSILGWRIPWTEEPGGLQSVGLHRVGHD